MLPIPICYRAISDDGTVMCTVQFIHLFIPLQSIDPIKVRETFGRRIFQYYVYIHAYKSVV
jgi:hypothetical protein